MINTKIVLSLTIIVVLSISLLGAMSMNAIADRDNNPHKGNNGQCRKLQSSLPDDVQDYEGCHDTFTGDDKKDLNHCLS